MKKSKNTSNSFKNEDILISNSVCWENIPNELKNNGLFCCYKAQRTKEGHYNKTPFIPVNGNPADVSDPSTFRSYQEAKDDFNWEANGYHGVGVLLTNNIGLIDIDDCYLFGDLSPLAKHIIEKMNTYTEISPSGCGIHILFKVKNNFKISTKKYYIKNPNNNLEIYLPDTGRYSTITGQHLVGTPKQIKIRSDEILEVFNEYMRRKSSNFKIKKPQKENPDSKDKIKKMSDKELLRRIRVSKSGEKFIDVYDFGNWRKHFKSQSEADMYLAGLFAFFTGKDTERISQLMLESPLYRQKWNTNKNYLERTIEKAIKNCKINYNPK